MTLAVLPARTGGAAENMAVDFLLLQRYPGPIQPRFRHYEWRAPAFTFGYSQKIAWVRPQLPPDGSFDVCRRPTGGGLVDHRDDWTYALVIPRGHPLEEVRAAQSYRAIHECLAAALRTQGVLATLQSASADAGAATGFCFQTAEIDDVVAPGGAKIAGAAQKRNKRGLLFQGSVWRPAAGGAAVDWEKFGEDFTERIGGVLGVTAASTPWPDFEEEEVSALTESYASAEWQEAR
jgi:lipoyl(octanoyl) transferase